MSRLKTAPEAPDARGLDVGTDASLHRAGFGASGADQARFASRLTNRMYSRAELPVRSSLLFASASALCFLGAAARMAMADPVAGAIAGIAGAVHAVLAARSEKRQRARAAKDGDADPSACFIDDDGVLTPRLEPGEQILWSRDADGPLRGWVRKAGGSLQALWGLLLAGLPIATVGAAPSPAVFALLTLATGLGAAMFGRGFRAMFGTDWVKRLVLTDRRLVALAAPGAAQSILLEGRRHRPVVVGRGEGKATFGLDVRPLNSVAPIQLMALYGFDSVGEETAKDLAGSVMDARLERIRLGFAVEGT